MMTHHMLSPSKRLQRQLINDSSVISMGCRYTFGARRTSAGSFIIVCGGQKTVTKIFPSVSVHDRTSEHPYCICGFMQIRIRSKENSTWQ